MRKGVNARQWMLPRLGEWAGQGGSLLGHAGGWEVSTSAVSWQVEAGGFSREVGWIRLLLLSLKPPQSHLRFPPPLEFHLAMASLGGSSIDSHINNWMCN